MNKLSKLPAGTFLLACALMLNACDAMKPAANDTGQVSEPALLGRIIDAETKLPLKGAFIYGHYATSSGTRAGGSKFGEHVKSFATETDEQGYFKLDAWNTGDRKVQGERRGKFPWIAVWKPGYEIGMRGLNSVSQWQPQVSLDPSQAKTSDGVIDWRAFPYALKPVNTEKDRYFYLTASGDPMMFDGECGWETYAGLLKAQHEELKAMVREYVRPDDIDPEGYIKSGRGRTQPSVEYITRTYVDRLKQEYRKKALYWKCANPEKIFAGTR